eukprot:412995-Pyramimonas_sp.AAC.1
MAMVMMTLMVMVTMLVMMLMMVVMLETSHARRCVLRVWTRALRPRTQACRHIPSEERKGQGWGRGGLSEVIGGGSRTKPTHASCRAKRGR